MILFIAMRNIIRNKKNSVVILVLISIITFLFFAGNTIIAQSGRGLRSAYMESLTGDIVIEKSGEVTMSLFGANAPHLEDFFLIETLPVYDKLVEVIETLPNLDMWTSQVSTGAYMQVLDESNAVFLTGVDTRNYFSVFPGITLEKGRFLEEGEYGAMISRNLAYELEHDAGHPLEIGTLVTFTTSGKTGFKIRKVPLVGIYSYQNTSSILNAIVLADAQTARALSAIRTASADVQLSDTTRILLDDDKFSAFFDDDSMLDDNSAWSESSGELRNEKSWEDNFYDLLQQEGSVMADTQSGGDWNFILLKLKKGSDIKKTINLLNERLAEYNVTAVDWKTAAGISAILVSMLQTLYNAGIFIICIAGIIAIVNILLIAVFKRTREIGTLRAIGASDNYIRLLLINENCFLGLAGGILGIVGGVVIFSIINMLDITINNDLIVNLLGVRVLNIQFFPEYAALSVVFSVILVFLSLLFPIETACRIEPIVAVREG